MTEILFRLKGIVHNGSINVIARKALLEWAKSIKEPTKVTIAFYPYKPKRTYKQNNLWKAIVRTFALHYGTDFEEARMAFKIRHDVSYVYSQDFDPAVVTTRPGTFYRYLNEYYYVISTSDYSKGEFVQLLNGTIQDCIEAGVTVEDLLAYA